MHRPFVASIAALLALSTAVATQEPFVDDAGRTVSVPASVARIFAAGAPAEVMLYTLAPDLLVGRNRVPSGDALEFFPPAYRQPILIRQLPEVDNPAADAELIALKPDVYIDYGTVAADYIASLEAVQRRTGVPSFILNGELSRIPEVYRRLGTALGLSERGSRLGASAERLLTKYRGALAAGGTPVRVYIACTADGYVPCLSGDSGGEQLDWLGAVNVAGTRMTVPRRPLTIDEIKAMTPDVVIAGGPVARLRADAAWQTVPAVAAGRVYQWPSLPYSWGARPPSVNRLPGVIWLATVSRARAFDSDVESDVRAFFREFYHLDLTDAQLRRLLAAS